eukprot:1373637-Amorphochlora_amoeboformis.AAC.1
MKPHAAFSTLPLTSTAKRPMDPLDLDRARIINLNFGKDSLVNATGTTGRFCAHLKAKMNRYHDEQVSRYTYKIVENDPYGQYPFLYAIM